MVDRGEHVDHRHVGRFGELDDAVVGKAADRDRVDVAGHDPADVADRFPAGDLQLVAAQDDGRATEFGDPNFERDPRPGRGLFEDHRHRSPRERVGPGRRAVRLELVGPIEQLAELAGELLSRNEIGEV